MPSTSWSDLLEQAEAEGFSGKLIDQGTYTATVEQTNTGTTQNGKAQAGIMWRIDDGGPFDRATVWDNVVLTPDNPKAMKVFFSKWAAMGISTDVFKTLPEGASALAALADLVKGVRCEIKVSHREWNGETKMNVFPQKVVTSSPAASVDSPAAAVPPAANPLADV